MSGWHREHPELIGTDADPWMMHESYRRHVPMSEGERDAARDESERMREQLEEEAREEERETRRLEEARERALDERDDVLQSQRYERE